MNSRNVTFGLWSIFRSSLGQIFCAEKSEDSAFLRRIARGLVWSILFSSPFLYDGSVPHPSYDLRWSVLHSGVAFGIALMGAIWNASKIIELSATPVIWLLLALLAVAAISQIDTLDTDQARWYFTHLTSYVGLTALIYWLRNERFFVSLMWAMILPIIPVSLLGIIQYHVIQTSDLPTWLRWIDLDFFHDNIKMAAPPAATYVNKNMAADYLTLVLPLCLWFIFQNGVKKWILLAALLLGSIFLMYTRCRAGWVAITFSFLFFGIWLAHIQKFNIKAAAKNLATSLAIALIVLGVGSMIATDNPGVTQLSVVDYFKTVKGETFENRLSLYLNSLVMAKDHWFNGVGIGNFKNVYPLYHDAVMPTGNSYGITVRPAFVHNDLVQTFAELGIVGGVLGVLICWLSISSGIKNTRSESLKNKPVEIQAIPMLAVTGCIGMLIDSLMSFPLQLPGGATMFFTVLGIIAGQTSLTQPPEGLWQIQFPLPRSPSFHVITCYGVFFAGTLLSWGAFCDNVRRREGAQALKTAMILAPQHSTIARDFSLQAIDESLRLYPASDEARELRGLIYSAYDGSAPLSDEQRMAVVEDFRKTSPFSAGVLLNYSQFLIKKLDASPSEIEKKKLQLKLSEIYTILKKIASFSEYTLVLGAEIAILEGDPMTARKLVEEAKLKKSNDPWIKQCFEKLPRNQ